MPSLVRNLETSQLGFNVVLAHGQPLPELDDAQHKKLAGLLHLENSQLQAIWQAFTSGGLKKLPLARIFA